MRETKAGRTLSSLTVSGGIIEIKGEVGQKIRPYLPNLPVLLFSSLCKHQQRDKALLNLQ